MRPSPLFLIKSFPQGESFLSTEAAKRGDLEDAPAAGSHYEAGYESAADDIEEVGCGCFVDGRDDGFELMEHNFFRVMFSVGHAMTAGTTRGSLWKSIQVPLVLWRW